MSYELLILPKLWLFAGGANKYDTLTGVVNKAYAKCRFRYNIIQSPRIKSPDMFLNDMLLNEEKDVVLMVLLGSKEKFDAIEKNHGYQRKFNSSLDPIDQVFDSDIPAEYASYFEQLTPDTDVKYIYAGPDYVVDQDVSSRVLATMGFKSYAEYGDYTENKVTLLDPITKHYELTLFTSFMKGAASGLLEHVLTNFVQNSKSQVLDHSQTSRCIIHAIVIKDHQLVPYYEKYCGFKSYGRPDILVSKTGEGSPLEEGVTATSDFHIAFLRREVSVN